MVLLLTLLGVMLIPSCRAAPLNGTIEVYMLGQNGKPENVYPLPECAGDCDDDSDCGPGLICFQHDSSQMVPGCLDGEEDETPTDYCIRGFELDILITDGLLTDTDDAAASIVPNDVSDAPTQAPTGLDTQAQTAVSPTHAATKPPASNPAASVSASSSHNTTRGFFQIRMHWTTKSCWQGDCKTDPGWCIQCEGVQCNQGDQLWVEPCRPDLPEMQLFEWIPVPRHLYTSTSLRASADTLDWGLLRSGWDPNSADRLCLERVGSTTYNLKLCDMTEYRQWFKGFDPDKPFELHEAPKSRPDSSTDLTHCITMPHHPRHYEHLYHTNCEESRKINSSLWFAVYGKKDESFVFDPESYYRMGDRRKDPRCTDVTKCGMCEGHCESDEQCEGSLRCFERSGGNPVERPPGCYGKGVPGMDYCYAKEGN